MRQVNQLAIALARAMHLRRDGRSAEAIEALEASMEETGLSDISRLLDLSHTEILRHLREPNGWPMDAACSIADVLFEYGDLCDGSYPDRSDAARERAIWIYEECLRTGQTVPLHVHQRLASTRDTDFNLRDRE